MNAHAGIGCLDVVCDVAIVHRMNWSHLSKIAQQSCTDFLTGKGPDKKVIQEQQSVLTWWKLQFPIG